MSEKISSANLGFEKEIFSVADKLRGILPKNYGRP